MFPVSAKAVISAHDYTYARGRLAVSVPSKPWEHQGANYTAFGHHRVREILAGESIDDRFGDAPVVAQCSSLGTMSQKYLDELVDSFATRKTGEKKKPIPKPTFQMIWPSVSDAGLACCIVLASSATALCTGTCPSTCGGTRKTGTGFPCS